MIRDEFHDLSEGEAGVYSSEPYRFPLDRQYRIQLKPVTETLLFRLYHPDWSPAIDSVYWTRDADGVTIKVDTRPHTIHVVLSMELRRRLGNKSPIFPSTGLAMESSSPEEAEITAMRLCWKRAKPLKLITVRCRTFGWKT